MQLITGTEMSARLRELFLLSESTREYLVPGPLAEIWTGSGFAHVLVKRPIFIFVETQCHAKLFFKKSLQQPAWSYNKIDKVETLLCIISFMFPLSLCNILSK